MECNGRGLGWESRAQQTNKSWEFISKQINGGRPIGVFLADSSLTSIFDCAVVAQEFQSSVLLSLAYLDTVVPAGSHVAFIPLVDGRVLFDTMGSQIHPLGVTYADLYEYLSCNGVNPCKSSCFRCIGGGREKQLERLVMFRT